MKTGRTRYSIPEEIEDLITESKALAELRDRWVKLPFGYRRARKLSIEAEKKQARFWESLYILYPKIKGCTITRFGNEIFVEEQ